MVGEALLVCPHCGAPNDPTVDVCPYCRVRRHAGDPAAGLAPGAWQVLAPGHVAWGARITVTLPASVAEHRVLRSHALLDDVDAEAEVRFERGQGWVPGQTASAFGLCVRTATRAGYDVGLSVAGLVSVSRYTDGTRDGWLVEPTVHPLVAEGIGATNRLGVTMIGDRLTVRLGGRAVASVRDSTLRSGAVELYVRPGSADVVVILSALSVRPVG